MPSNSPSYYHINPVIAQLEKGSTVYGLVTEDLSLYHARECSQAPVDFIYVDFEHNPLDFPALHHFLLGMTDKKTILRRGDLQPDCALFARFPTSAENSGWVIKQALDIGLHGVILNDIETSSQALEAIKMMRYPKRKGDQLYHPKGSRGFGPRNAAWIWGISPEEYEERADLWPLNSKGDLLAIVMIESEQALNNVESIALTPGVGLLFVGGGNDLARSLGVPRESGEVEAGFQKVLRICKKHGVFCGISAKTAQGIAKRKQEGWNLIRAPLSVVEGVLKREAQFNQGSVPFFL